MHRTNGLLLRPVARTRLTHGRQTRKVAVARGQADTGVQEPRRGRVERVWVYCHDDGAQCSV